MKILLDENFPQGFKSDLSNIGHDVKHINQVKKGLTDNQVFELAVKEKRTLISNDVDFKKYKKRKHYGIIKFLYKDSNIPVLFKILKYYSKNKLEDCYIDFNKKNIYIEEKVFSKKGKFKQFKRRPLNL